jgi:hypothetical protein
VRKPKCVDDVRRAVRLHVLKKGEYGCRRAAQEANAANPAVVAGDVAAVTSNDVHRYSQPFLTMVAGDEELSKARSRVEEAEARAMSTTDDLEVLVEVRVAKEVLKQRVVWVSEKVAQAILELKLAQRGNPDLKLQRVFSNDEEWVLATFFEYMSMAGFPLSLPRATELLTSVAKEMGCGEDFKGTAKFVEGLRKRTGKIFGARKASALDPKRAAAADPKVRDAFFDRTEEYYAQLHEDDPVRWPWATLKDVPPDRVYNFDEEGEDANKRRGKVLAATALQRGGLHRVFERTFGDHPPFHATFVATIRADGKIWPPPMIIHSCPNNDDPALTHELAEGIYVKGDDGTYTSPSGIKVIVTKTGSMLQTTFPVYIKHFLENVPDDGLGNILLFDGHVSRWVPEALYSLMQRGVAPVCEAAQSSVWGQACDCGFFGVWKGHAAEQSRVWRSENEGVAFNRAHFNHVFLKTWKKAESELQGRLRDSGSNAITLAFEATGTSPWNRCCSNWTAAISSLGIAPELARGNMNAVLERQDSIALGGADVGASVMDLKYSAVAMRTLDAAELLVLSHAGCDDETSAATAQRIVTESWRRFAVSDAPFFAPIGPAQKAAFKACGSPHEKAVFLDGGVAAARELRRLKAKLSAISEGEAAKLRRTSSGIDEIAVRRRGGWLVTAPSSEGSRIVADADLQSAVGVTFDSVAALSSVAEAAEGTRRVDLARRDRAREKKEVNNHATRVANLVLESRAKHDAVELQRRIGITDEQFKQTIIFLKTPRKVSVMGHTATSTFNGTSVAARSLVLESIARPLEASALAVAEARAKKKPRKQGVPCTSKGLTGPEMLKEIDEITARKAAEALAKESAAATRKASWAANLQADFDSKIPAIVAKLEIAGGDVTKLAIAPLVLLVRWLQQQHPTEPTYKVKSTYARTDLHPLIAEYFRVRIPPTELGLLMVGLRRAFEERIAALSAAAAAAIEEEDEDEDDVDQDLGWQA